MAGLAAPGMASADENLLGYTVGADTLPQGTGEAYLFVTQHSGKRQGDYSAQYFRGELEYGFTDRLNGAVYLNAYRHDYSGDPVPGEIDGSRNEIQFSGFSTELKYMVTSPYKDPIGIALYGEITYDTVDSLSGDAVDAWEFETKLILHKPYLDDRLNWVTNFEFEFEHESEDDESEIALAPRLRTGFSYRVANNWYLGAEGWVDMEVVKEEDESWAFDHWDAFAGPSIHYGGQRWWATVTWAHQLAGSNEVNSSETDFHLADHERDEIRLKLGYNF